MTLPNPQILRSLDQQEKERTRQYYINQFSKISAANELQNFHKPIINVHEKGIEEIKAVNEKLSNIIEQDVKKEVKKEEKFDKLVNDLRDNKNILNMILDKIVPKKLSDDDARLIEYLLTHDRKAVLEAAAIAREETRSPELSLPSSSPEILSDYEEPMLSPKRERHFKIPKITEDTKFDGTLLTRFIKSDNETFSNTRAFLNTDEHAQKVLNYFNNMKSKVIAEPWAKAAELDPAFKASLLDLGGKYPKRGQGFGSEMKEIMRLVGSYNSGNKNTYNRIQEVITNLRRKGELGIDDIRRIKKEYNIHA